MSIMGLSLFALATMADYPDGEQAKACAAIYGGVGMAFITAAENGNVEQKQRAARGFNALSSKAHKSLELSGVKSAGDDLPSDVMDMAVRVAGQIIDGNEKIIEVASQMIVQCDQGYGFESTDL